MRPARDRVVLIALLSLIGACQGGGTRATPPSTSPPSSPEVTGFSTPPPPVAAPVARGYAMMADLPGEPGVEMLGGKLATMCCWPDLPEMWIFSPGSVWQEVAPPSLPELPGYDVGVMGTAFEFDRRSEKAVFVDSEGNVWVYDPGTNAWEATEGGKGPTALHGATMVYDARSDRMIVFGGWDPGDFSYNDETWSWDLDEGAWVEMSPKRHPSARNYYQAAYDPVSDRMILFGGSDDFDAFGDTWSYDLESDTWTELAPEVWPPARTYGWMVYDPVGRRMILFGGTDYPAEEPMGDTWSFDPKTETWTELDVPGPSARGWHAMAYDAETETIVLFGGGTTRDDFTAETWLFDVRSNTWSQVG